MRARTLLAVAAVLFGGPALAANSLQNGGFDGGTLDPWSLQTQLGASGTAEVVSDQSQAGGHSAHVTVTRASSGNTWYVQLLQDGQPLTSGQPLQIVFWAKADASRGGEVALQGGAPTYPTYFDQTFTLGTAWTRYVFNFTPGTTDGAASFEFNLAQATGQVWIDSVSLGPPPPPPALALTVNTALDRHAISPDIYGLNHYEASSGIGPVDFDSLGVSVNRWGGNDVETYNWQLGSRNLANDYFFENVADCFSPPSYDCSGGNPPEYLSFVADNLAHGRKPLIAVPLMGYVAKDAPSKHPLTCSYPVTQFPQQSSYDSYDPNCGNGTDVTGKKLTTSPTTAGKAIGTPFVAAWIKDLVTRFHTAHNGGLPLYELGNEPGLWNSTHQDMHPDATTYDELAQKSIDMAVAIKARDPSAKILAFSEAGWNGFFRSAADVTSNDSDRAAHGGTPLVEWLLQQFAAHQQSTGKRIVDYVDVHYYPEGPMPGGPVSTDDTRSLWDQNYVDPSYINDTIRLIPRMREWVANDYPGTKTAITEYDLSIANEPVKSAIIQADVLGIFARERLDLATRFLLPLLDCTSAHPDCSDGALDGTYDAFRLYRNYDGAGARFGETWVRALSTDQSRLAVYAAVRAADNTLTVVVLNKTSSALGSKLTLKSATPKADAQVWRWTATSQGIVRLADQAFDGTRRSYPALSMTLYVVPLN
jgi:hypothetical protein